MIKKDNLLPDEDIEFSIQILPEIPGLHSAFETEISLLPDKEIKITWKEADQEIIYCLSGNGIVSFPSLDLTIQRGDRIIIDEKQDYVIQNSGLSPLDFIRRGISIIPLGKF